MTTSALYARYSSEEQRATSIEDQLRNARALAERNGDADLAIYSDAGISGTRTDRPDFVRLLRDCQAGIITRLYVDDLYRLTRAEDMPQLMARFKFWGVQIRSCDGYDSTRADAKIMAWTRGLIGNMYLEVLAKNVHRSQTGAVARGCHAGGMPYGYDTIPADPRDDDAGRKLVVIDHEAQIVREIFQKYSEGWNCGQIAYDLNARGIPSPRGSSWDLAGIYGHPVKGTGILNNEIYIGRYIWNRSQWIKNPDTGKRKRVERPREEWHIVDHPELRIVQDDVWRAVKNRQAGNRNAERVRRGRPASSLFGGLLRCGLCGGPVVVVDGYRYGCNHAKMRGPSVCTGLRIDKKRTDAALLAHLREHLLSPGAITALQASVREQLRARTTDRDLRLVRARTRLPEVRKEIANLTESLAKIGYSDALLSRLQKAEAERAELEKLLEETPPDTVVQMIPRLLERYRAAIEAPGEILQREPQKARQALRAIMGEIKLEPAQGGTWARLSGLYAGLVAVADKTGSGAVIHHLSAPVRVWIPDRDKLKNS